MRSPNNGAKSAFILLNFLVVQIVATEQPEYLNPTPKQLANDASTPNRFESPSGSQEIFTLIQADGDSVILGARDAVFNLSATNLDPKFTIPWKALGQTIEECHMKGKSESECHNYVRVVVPLRSGRLLVCGTHSFSPLCREFEYSMAEDRYVERQEYSGQGIAPFDPLHNSTFVYLRDSNEIFVGTVTDFGSNDPLIYRKRLPRGEVLRTPKDDLRVIDHPDFVGSFAYRDHIYFWYREKAAEGMDNNQERQNYARVGRVCQNDRGGPSPATERWSSFLKARLNCSIPASVPFYFNELQSISEPVEDGQGDATIFGVFQTARSTVFMSAVCAFRLSQVAEVFDHGRFKTQRTPTSAWSSSPRLSHGTDRPGRCVSDSRKLSDVSFILKNPLMYDLVPSASLHPLIVEGPAKPEMTAVFAVRGRSVRGQWHHVLYVGRSDGHVAKIVEIGSNQSSVFVENVRVFVDPQPIRSIRKVSERELVVVGMDRVMKLPIEHCRQQIGCAACVRLRDPHCAWDVEEKACVYKSDWSGSFIQNVLTGVSEQCPTQQVLLPESSNDGMSESYIVEESNGAIAIGHLEASDAGMSSAFTTIVIVVIIAVIGTLFVGVFLGYRITKWRLMNTLHSPVDSSNGSDCDSYGHRARLTRHDSITMHHKTSDSHNPHHHVYASAPVSRGGADAVSLVFNASTHSAHLPMMSISNGGSGLATPRFAAERFLMNGAGATLPRDYRVKKVYL
ncbi:Semaphorin-1A [Aphelenchoides besseyi]|nr:Semaphorin-1A [Aphelenchoides besseyi]